MLGNNNATNLGVQISLRDPNFNTFGYISKSEIAELYDSSSFNILRNHSLFSIVAVLICTPNKNTLELPAIMIKDLGVSLAFFWKMKLQILN